LPESLSWAGPPTFFVWNVSLDDGGKVMLAGGWNLSLWDVKSHRRLGAPIQNQPVTSSRISPDGKMAAAVSGGNLMLWDLGSRAGRPLVVKSGSFAGDALAFSSDGRWLVTNTRDGRLLIRATDHDEEILSEKIHEAPVSSIAFSPNDKLLASAGTDGRIAVWSRESRKLVFGPYNAYDGGSVSLSFDRSGDRLVTVLWDMREIAYTESVGSPKVRACRMVGRSFTRREWEKLFENEPYSDTCSKYRSATEDPMGIEVLFRAEGNLDRSTRWPSEPRVDSFRLQNPTGKTSRLAIHNEKGRILVLPEE
jgi:WD40 repeat protein